MKASLFLTQRVNPFLKHYSLAIPPQEDVVIFKTSISFGKFLQTSGHLAARPDEDQ